MVVTILDFLSGVVNIHSYPKDVECVETFIREELGYDTNNCQWMCTNELELVIHEI